MSLLCLSFSVNVSPPPCFFYLFDCFVNILKTTHLLNFRIQALSLLDDVLFHVNFYFLLFKFLFVLLVIMCALCIVFNKTCFQLVQ